MKPPRTICVVTGTRADYGLLFWLMKELQDDAAIQLQVVATGMHLSPEFGSTVNVIEQDGFEIAARVDMLLSGDTPVAIAKSIGLGVIGFADTFDRLRPDIVVILGDRFEILAAAQAAMTARIPIAHIHGGESTEGVIDEAIRHAITKMSHLHFTATETYRTRVIQLGEQPERVHMVGTPGLDAIAHLKFLQPSELGDLVGFPWADPTFILTYHPVTLSEETSLAGVESLLQALDGFPNAHLIFTGVNADTDGRGISRLIRDYVTRHKERTFFAVSLGQRGYLSAMHYASVVIGNSSSGILEAPTLGTPTVNIGDRQKGRLKDPSIIDCGEDVSSIRGAIEKALSDKMQEVARTQSSLYGKPGACEEIAEILKNVSLDGILQKTFYDLDPGLGDSRKLGTG